MCSRLLLGLTGLTLAAQNPQGVPENATQRVSEHVFAIVGFPNVAIVVGSRATLVVDSGMGAKNGAVIVKEARKLSKNQVMYLTTTHFHPEHATGDQAFPPGTILIRNARQQQEMEARGQEYIDLFSSRSAQNKELLTGVKLRKPDVTYDRESRLDLGGVTARLFWVNPAHTQGDELIFVEEDSVLVSGDIVQSKLVPNMPNEDSSVSGWLAILDLLDQMKPKLVVPDHGDLGDGSLVAKQRAFMVDVRTRTLAYKRKGMVVEDAVKSMQADVKAAYPDWPNLGPLANFVRRIYAEDK